MTCALVKAPVERSPQNPNPSPPLPPCTIPSSPSYSFMPSARWTRKLCLTLKSNMISSLPPGMA